MTSGHIFESHRAKVPTIEARGMDSAFGTYPFNPFPLRNSRPPNHYFERLRAVATMGKIDFDHSIALASFVIAIPNPCLMRAFERFEKHKAVLLQETNEVLVGPIEKSPRHCVSEYARIDLRRRRQHLPSTSNSGVFNPK